MHSRSILWVMPLALILAGAGAAQAQGTAFTYQGHLTDNGAAARGSYDLQFLLFDAAEAGIQQGVTLNRFGLAISNGLFTTTLDFGPNRFAGAPRWLEIRVSLANAANYATLTPRQPLTPAPYAMFASSASTAATAASVLWSAVIGVPVGFTDGVDNDTLYGAGLGLNLGSGNLFSVLYAGSGTSTSAARSDHDHLGQSWTGSQTRGLSVTTTLTSGTGVAGLLGRQGTGGGASLIIPSGLWGDSSDGQGVLGTAAGVNCRGVLGWNFGTNGLGTGVQGQSASSSGRGVWGLAYATTGTNHGVYGQSESPEGYGVYGANDAGVAIKAGGTGIIQSAARSFVFAPGGLLQRSSSSSAVRVECLAFGARVYSGGFVGDTTCALPIIVPAVFYGQNVTVKSFSVYYRCENGANNYITTTSLSVMVDADTAANLVSEANNHTSNTASSYTLYPLCCQELSSTGGGLTLLLTLHFANDTDYINIGGVRVELSHE